MNPPAELRFLGVRITPMDTEEFMHRIFLAVDGGRGTTVFTHHNLHSLYLYPRSVDLRRFHERSDYCYIDGTPLLWIARLYGHRLPMRFRLTCVDWLKPFLTRAIHSGLHVFILAGRPGVAETAIRKLGLDGFAGSFACHHGHFDATPGSTDNLRVLETIADANPDILIVGMGMPRQEAWVIANIDEIHTRVVITVGACLDYPAGAVATPPRWMGPLGLEWLGRLVSEPRRLAFRYLVEPWAIAGRIGMDILRLRSRRTGPP